MKAKLKAEVIKELENRLDAMITEMEHQEGDEVWYQVSMYNGSAVSIADDLMMNEIVRMGYDFHRREESK